jgi:uncharacterized protein
MKRFLAFIFLFLSVCANAQIEKVVPPAPIPPKLVNDLAHMLTAEQVQALENKLVAYNDSTSSQIAVVTVNSLEGYDIAEYALALGRKWQVGGKEFNNGIVLLVAKEDRKARIEVGPGLEGPIPDVTAKSIIDNELTPNFKEGNYYRGLDEATDAIIKAAAGEYKKAAKKGSKGSPFGFLGILVFIILMIFIGRKGGRGGGGMASRRGFGDVGTAWILGSLLGGGRGGGGGWSGGGGGGGGGFGGFGGGSFGGGGASGSW